MFLLLQLKECGSKYCVSLLIMKDCFPTNWQFFCSIPERIQWFGKEESNQVNFEELHHHKWRFLEDGSIEKLNKIRRIAPFVSLDENEPIQTSSLKTTTLLAVSDVFFVPPNVLHQLTRMMISYFSGGYLYVRDKPFFCHVNMKPPFFVINANFKETSMLLTSSTITSQKN